jgi:hypothetical protein
LLQINRREDSENARRNAEITLQRQSVYDQSTEPS